MVHHSQRVSKNALICLRELISFYPKDRLVILVNATHFFKYLKEELHNSHYHKEGRLDKFIINVVLSLWLGVGRQNNIQ